MIDVYKSLFVEGYGILFQDFGVLHQGSIASSATSLLCVLEQVT